MPIKKAREREREKGGEEESILKQLGNPKAREEKKQKSEMFQTTKKKVYLDKLREGERDNPPTK